MVTMNLKISEILRKQKERCSTLAKKYGPSAGQAAAAIAVMSFPTFAHAAEGSAIFCFVADYFKQIVGAAALVAIFMWAIEHIFGAAKLHDVVIKVGVACGIVIAGATMIAKSGLTVNC